MCTFPLQVYTIIELGHRITYGNCEAVNLFEQSNLSEQHEHTTILSLLSILILGQSHDT